MSNSRWLQLIAPSGYAPDLEVAIRGIKVLRRLGFSVANLAVIERRYLRFAGTLSERVDEINYLAKGEHPLPDVILMMRGGYGASQLLEWLDYQGLDRCMNKHGPVMLVGHSDFTALQMALLARAKITTFAGPMLLSDFGAKVVSNFTLSHFQSMLNYPEHTVRWVTDAWQDLNEAGLLWGGNLSVLVNLVGTPFFPKIDGGILFLEEVNESLFRIERMLYQLHLSGILCRQKAIIFGQFTECRVSDYDNGYEILTMIDHLRSLIRIPIVTRLPFGHVYDKLTLPVGGHAQLKVEGAQAVLRLSQYPCRGV
nr:muramoyltetrapeptide carboxypeptidase [Candidatus Pandoraea novymonadis]